MKLEYVCDEHSDILDMGWNEKLSARVLGRDMALIVKKNKTLNNKILEILDSSISENHISKIAQLMLSGMDDTIEKKIEVLSNLRQGILDVLNKSDKD